MKVKKITIKNNNKVVFLDRDGVINVDTGYLCDVDKLQFIPGSLEAMRLLQESGFTLAIITNQSGLARGYFNLLQFNLFMESYFEKLSYNGIEKPFFYFCPHHPYGTVKSLTKECDCRKPLPGMLLQAAAELKINLHNSYFIGDKLTDMKAGLAAGISNLFLLSQEKKIESSGTQITISDCLLSVAKSLVTDHN